MTIQCCGSEMYEYHDTYYCRKCGKIHEQLTIYDFMEDEEDA
jgi:hypothetical protein